MKDRRKAAIGTPKMDEPLFRDANQRMLGVCPNDKSHAILPNNNSTWLLPID
jgi:hypothetical protein